MNNEQRTMNNHPFLSQSAVDDNAYAKMAQAVNPYGDGRAAKRIVRQLPVYRYHNLQTRERKEVDAGK